eukprot:TRINITY_DN46549_c0_g1_i1.p1 TRINITY_DN46549_c0_g1~~TRINITY_DN46549_c0_g1_i1.p1  ORF type:complete len:386 (-),score=13.02 TRINITY_DN46549_c0_g1_i1:220-1377(-)
MLMHGPYSDRSAPESEDLVLIDRWCHVTSSHALRSIHEHDKGLIPQRCHSVKYDGALTDPEAPKGIWFEANVVDCNRKRASVYPLVSDDGTDHVGLMFDVHCLLASFNTEWRMYRVCNIAHVNRMNIVHYAIVAPDSAEWFENQHKWQKNNGYGTQQIERVKGDESAIGKFADSCSTIYRRTRTSNAETQTKFSGFSNNGDNLWTNRSRRHAVHVLGCCKGPVPTRGTELCKEGPIFVWRSVAVRKGSPLTNTVVGVFLVPPTGKIVSSELILSQRILAHVPSALGVQKSPVDETRWQYKWMETWCLRLPCEYERNEERVACNECNLNPIIGVRYKCMQCDDYDLCFTCAADLGRFHCSATGGLHGLRPIGRPGERHMQVIHYLF